MTARVAALAGCRMSALGSFIAATHADHEEREALRLFAGRPLVEACAPDAHAELELVEVVQILCRRVRSLERQLAEARR